MNTSRRNFLKIALFGGGALVLGKVLGPVFSRIVDGPSEVQETSSFRTVENNKTLTIYDKSGTEIFQIDKGE